MCQKIIDYFKDKKILVLGYGREGKSTFAFLRRNFPEMKIFVADKNPVSIEDDNAELISGENYLDCIGDFDLVMQSPGITLRDIEIPENTEITGQMDLFLRFASCCKIGITGTKGKSTTTTLIYNVLKEAGKKCFIMGNIGTPVFDMLPEAEGSYAVIEMSCHQLEFSKASPEIAVFTNLYPEHLDHYRGFEGYKNAKLNIVKFQDENDLLIAGSELKSSLKTELSNIKSKIMYVSENDGDRDSFLGSLCNINKYLIGENGRQDSFFAAAVGRYLGVDESSIFNAVKNFKGIPHRLEEVGTFGGITFFNDSIATIPRAVQSNIKALGNVDTLIFGGLDRGIDYGEFISFLEESPVKNLIGLPDTGYKIIDELRRGKAEKNTFKADTMDEAVKKAHEVTSPGKICLFSPAAASYNRYKSFEEKGSHYKSLCKSLGEQKV